MATTVALSEAKAGLSSLVKNVHETGAEYTVTVRGVPLAMIVPVPPAVPAKPKALGMLAGKKPVATREQEKAAYRRDLEAKHANPA